MRLHLERETNERTGAFGRSKGTEYTLHYKLELTEQEQAIVSTLDLGGAVLTEWNDQRGRTVELTVAVAQKGQTHVESSLVNIGKSEITLRERCSAFSRLVNTCQNYSGSSTFEL